MWNYTTFQHHLATLRARGRRNLMHLSASKQRAVILINKKLVEKGRKDENEMLPNIKLNANRSISMRWVWIL